MLENAGHLTMILRRTIAAGVLMGGAAGCSTILQESNEQRAAVPLIVRYECLGQEGGKARWREAAEGDFNQIRSWGFSGIWADYADVSDWEAVAAAGRSAGLDVALRHPDIDEYIEWGCLPAGVRSMGEAMTQAALAPRSKPRAILALPPFPREETLGRVIEVSEAFATLRPAGKTLALMRDWGTPEADGVSTIWCGLWQRDDRSPPHCEGRRLVVVGHDSGGAPVWTEKGLRRAYYEGVAAGNADGVLIWRFRSWPGEANGLLPAEGDASAVVVEALRALLRRAAEWAPLVAGARPVKPAPPMLQSRSLRCTLLQRPGRRLILIDNADFDHFSRGVLRVPTSLLGEPVSRVVVADDGTRYTRSEGPLTVPLHVRPGEAVLLDVH